MLHVHTGFLFKNVNILRILLKHLDSKILTVVASIVKPYLLLPVDWDSHESNRWKRYILYHATGLT